MRFLIWMMLYPVLPILYFVLRSAAKPKKNVTLGVTLPPTRASGGNVTLGVALPPDAHVGGQVDEIVKSFRRNMNWMFLTMTLVIVPCLFARSFGVGFMLNMVWMALCIIAPFAPYIAAHRRLRALKKERGWETYPDDDSHWPLGLFYWNPDDSHVLINERVGLGMTVNLAKRGAQLLYAFIALIILAMPLVGVWVLREERSPIELTVSSDALTAKHAGTAYEIPFDEIQSAELLDALPPLRRVNGSALGSVLKGRFASAEIGGCTLLLDPRTETCIKIITPARTYLLGANSARETAAVFARLGK